MRLAAAVVMCLVLGAAPAYAQSGPPTTFNFDGLAVDSPEALIYPATITVTTHGLCGGSTTIQQDPAAVSPSNVMETNCAVSFARADADLGEPTTIEFFVPQKYVAIDIKAGLSLGAAVELRAFDASEDLPVRVAIDTDTTPPFGWRVPFAARGR